MKGSAMVDAADDADPDSGPQQRVAARARVEQALVELDALDQKQRSAVPAAVGEALSAANEALAGRSECRKDTPFAEIVLIGDAGGLRLQCTHHPPHDYPL